MACLTSRAQRHSESVRTTLRNTPSRPAKSPARCNTQDVCVCRRHTAAAAAAATAASKQAKGFTCAAASHVANCAGTVASGAGGGGAATVADGLGVARVGVHVAHVGERDLRVGHLAGVAREVLRRVERHLIHGTCTAQHSTHVDSMAMRRHERLSTENKHHHDVCGEDRLEYGQNDIVS